MGYYFKRAANGEYISEETRKLWNCWWCSWDAAKTFLQLHTEVFPDDYGTQLYKAKEELKQLRAERAGLLDELQEAYDDPQGDIMWRAGIARAMGIIKSKLTDSAQSGEGE